MTDPATRATKAELRAQVRGRRRARPEADRLLAAEGIAAALDDWPPLRAAHSVAAYLAMPAEPDPGLVCARLSSQGTAVWMPVVTTLDGQPGLQWTLRSEAVTVGEPTRSGLRVPEPVGTRHDDPGVDLVLMPALAVDTRGVRLGQGGGYYDRTIERLGWGSGPSPLLVAVVYDDEFLDVVPTEPHDTRVHAVVTPTGLHELP